MPAFTETEMKDFKITDWYDLSGQVAVVTGGSTGLGLAITRCLVSAGAKVCVVSFESPEQAAEALEGFGDRTVFYQFDITDTGRAQEQGRFPGHDPHPDSRACRVRRDSERHCARLD